MNKKYQNKYTYTNYLKRCPNCGATLNSDTRDCPNCEINLIGYNEKENRADNLTQYADDYSELTERNDRLNEKIRKYNDAQDKFDNAYLKVRLKMLIIMLCAVTLLLIVPPILEMVGLFISVWTN